MRKNLFRLMAVLIMATLVLSACSPAATPTAEPTTAPVPEQPTSAPVEPTAAPTAAPVAATEPAATVAPTAASVPVVEIKNVQPKGDGKLTLWVAGNSPEIQAAYNTVVQNFMKDNPAFSVKVEYVGWGDLSTKLTTAFAGNVGPDVFMHGVAASAGYMAKDQILDMTSYFNQMPDKADFLPGLIQAGTVGGKLAMMPNQVTNYMLIYRKDLYQAAGLDPEKAPQTWEELIANAQKLTKSDDKGITTAGLYMPYDDNADVEMAFAPILRTYGGDLLSADGKTAAFNSDAGKAALQIYVDLFLKDKVTPASPLPGDPNTSTIGRGAAAQMISGQFDLATIKQADPAVYKQIGVALPPAGPSGKPTTMSSFSGFMINKNTKNPDDAWTLVSYLSSPASLTAVDSALLFLAPRASLANADFVTADPLFKAFADGLTYGQGNPNVPQWIQVRNALGEQLINAINGKSSVEDTLKTAETNVNGILSK